MSLNSVADRRILDFGLREKARRLLRVAFDCLRWHWLSFGANRADHDAVHQIEKNRRPYPHVDRCFNSL